jgi:hypothetical protein
MVDFNGGARMAERVVGPVHLARLWNVLAARVRAGKPIDDLATRAVIASVVGKPEAAKIIAAVQRLYHEKDVTKVHLLRKVT